MSAATQDAERQHVADKPDHAQRTDDVDVDDQLVLGVVTKTIARGSQRRVCRHT